jgi:hypothetical protein
MGARVFLSYSSQDQAQADAVCKALEGAGISCWIAHRDLAAGSQWGGGIVRAIDDCDAVVVVFSANANNSPQVAREMELAVGKRKPLVPIRIRDELPTADMPSFLGVSHWFNAHPQPIDHYLPEIVPAVRRVLDSESPGAWREIDRRLSALTGGKVDPRLLLGGGAVLLLLLLLLLVLLFRGHGDAKMPNGPLGMVPSELVGRWQAELKDQNGRNGTCLLDIADTGTTRFSDGCPLPFADSQGPLTAVKGATWAAQNYKPDDDGTFLLQGAGASLAAAYKVAGDTLVTRDDKLGEVTWTRADASEPLPQGGLPQLPGRVPWPLAGVPALTGKTTAYLRGKWQPDAVPMSIKISLADRAGAPSSDGTVARDMVSVQYEYYSPSTQQGASVTLGGASPSPLFPLGVIDRSASQALPENFIDLPAAFRTVRSLGMRANLPSEAQLSNWSPGTSYGSARLGGLQWMIDSPLDERYVAAAYAP